MVICSTVDQVGSSLLFRARIWDERVWAVDPCRTCRLRFANHSGRGAHQPSISRTRLISSNSIAAGRDEPLAPSFTAVEMSATPRGEAFRETPGDLENEVLKRRWEASKKAKLVAVEPQKDEEAAKGGFTGLVGTLVKEARVLREERGAKVIGVVANRVRTARRVHEALAKEEGCEAILLTGRSRPYDRDAIWEGWQPFIGLGGKRYAEKTVFVVATQCVLLKWARIWTSMIGDRDREHGRD